ncbi:RNA-dependent ATPase rok1 [Lithohypha guttulata]|nr:RNA-dependent ATPase rok1 [Lithohypha guttulata]
MDSLRLLSRGSGRRLTGKDSVCEDKRPSAGSQQASDSEESSTGKKRKRAEFEADTNGKLDECTIEKIRSIQKQHKIRITNLRALHKAHDTDNRKAQKEASRLFPQPLQKFSALRDLDVNHTLLSNLVEQGYREPTEVQVATIPLLMPRHGEEPDLLTVAPTGSGKTLAFLIPLINKLSKTHQDKDAHGPVKAIILAPTKELVVQIVNEGRKLAAKTGIRVTAFKKGMRLHEDTLSVGQGISDESDVDEETQYTSTIVKADILVSTPLSLLHAITPTTSDDPLALSNIQNLILDEADVLLDPLFRAQTLSIWSACVNPELRSSLWSATIGSSIEELTISTVSSRHKSLGIKSKSAPLLLRCIIGLKDSSLPNITHKLIYTSTEAGKLTGLRQLIRPSPSNTSTSSKAATTPSAPFLRPPFLVFTQTISRAEALYNELKYDIPPPSSFTTTARTSTVEPIPRIALLHSSLGATARSKIMQNFRLGKIWILITTDLLSRGIDFRGVNGVVNYDIPTTSASYVHRAGRTGRAGREGGVCVTFYTKDDVSYLRPIATVIAKSQKTQGGASPDGGDGTNGLGSGVPSWLLDALPHLTKNKKKDLKERGVDVRRGVKESDDKKQRRRKGRNMIGTKSGYEKKVQDRRQGAIEGSRRRKENHTNGVGTEEEHDGGFEGFD